MPALRPNDSSVTGVIIERGDRFFVYEPTLGVIASDDSAAKAYDKFAAARRAYLDDLQNAGLSMAAAPSAWAAPGAAAGIGAGPRVYRGVWAELGLFVAKSCIVVAVFALLAATAANQAARAVNRVAQSVDQALDPIKTISLADVVRKAADVARDAQDLPPERKESLRRSIAAIALEVEPFREAWSNPAQTLSSTPQPADGTKR
jgi:hypothetical protein